MGAPSKTALLVAAYRGRASAREEALFRDPWAAALAGTEGLALSYRYDEAFPHMELWTAVRTSFIDRHVRWLCSRASRPARQVVLLGAGLDTRAARLGLDDVRFFEVDHPATQEDKLERLARVSEYPRDRAAYVPCDFETDDFLARLAAAGLDTSEPSVVVWEGVTYYLTEQAVRATLHRIAHGLDASSTVLFDYVRRKLVRGEVRDPDDLAAPAFVAELGEPLRFGVDYPLPMLYEEGFRKIRALTFDEICLDKTGTYDRERAFRFQGVVLASRTTSL